MGILQAPWCSGYKGFNFLGYGRPARLIIHNPKMRLLRAVSLGCVLHAGCWSIWMLWCSSEDVDEYVITLFMNQVCRVDLFNGIQMLHMFSSNLAGLSVDVAWPKPHGWSRRHLFGAGMLYLGGGEVTVEHRVILIKSRLCETQWLSALSCYCL